MSRAFAFRDVMADPIKPPTIGHLKSMGLTGVYVTCRGCQRSRPLPFDALKLPDETLFPDVERLRRFRCADCGGSASAVTPDWRDYNAHGTGCM
jgi:hypothetical protein